MKKFVALSLIAAASLSLTACSKSGEPEAANSVETNATENAAIEDINAAAENVTDAAANAIDNAAAAPADNVVDNAANAM
jgi:PBP1b-binding outer membrane lipoprotein LpoB